MPTRKTPRQEAARQFASLIEIEFFRTLCDPVRLQIVAALIEGGRTDISTLAERFPQDRSVISRHLAMLESVGIVQCEKSGRHKHYDIDGKQVVEQLKKLTTQVEQIIVRCAC